MSGKEDISNSYATKWMKNIPNYKKRFIPIITKADELGKEIGIYHTFIKTLELKNRPSLIINRGDDKTITY